MFKFIAASLLREKIVFFIITRIEFFFVRYNKGKQYTRYIYIYIYYDLTIKLIYIYEISSRKSVFRRKIYLHNY